MLNYFFTSAFSAAIFDTRFNHLGDARGTAHPSTHPISHIDKRASMSDLIRYDHGIYAIDSGYIRPRLAAVHLTDERG